MFESINQQLVQRIPEVSYLVASALMVFTSDFAAESFFKSKLKKMSFLSRTATFLLYGLLVLPAATAGVAALLRSLVLNPHQQWLIVILLGFFILIGVLLSWKYHVGTKRII